MIVAHVGLPKTASTFLQKHFFPQFPKVGFDYYSTEKNFDWPNELDWIFEVNKIWWPDLLTESYVMDYQQREQLFICRVEKLSTPWLKQAKQLRNRLNPHTIISAEGFCGKALPTAELSATILHEMGVEKLIYIYRNQADWSMSAWRQMILREDVFARYLPYHDLFIKESDLYCSNPIDMNWVKYVEMYQKVFGKDNVLAIPYEMMKESSDDFLKHILKFMNIAEMKFNFCSTVENPSYEGDHYTGWKLDQNSFFLKFPRIRARVHKHLTPWVVNVALLNKLLLKIYKVPPVSQELKSDIKRQFKESNQNLAELSGFDLEKYGYF